MRTKVLIFIVVIFSHFACENSLNPIMKNEIHVTKLNIEGMRNKHLPDFKLVSKQARREGREFVFQDLNDVSKIVFIRVGIHSSRAKAQYVAEELNSWCSIIPQEDSKKILGIGDKLWWMPDVDSPDTVAYEFTRNNVFVITNSHTFTYNKLLELTKAIDNDIKNHATYITFKDSISLPVIQSISVSKPILTEGDTARVTVNAIDPDNESLEYLFTWGLSQPDNVPENVFVFHASRDYVPDPFVGSHIIEFIVINESNVVSETADFTITIIQ